MRNRITYVGLDAPQGGDRGGGCRGRAARVWEHGRIANTSAAIRDIAWKGQVRLCARYHRKLARSGKPANVVTIAIARELAGFVWAIARQVMAAAG